MTPGRRPQAAATALAFAALLAAPAAHAFESDVHFGLTRWLALRAGFDDSQAQAIAVANQRIDGGMLEYQALAIEAVCAGRFPEAAARAQRLHFPSVQAVPAPPERRAVEAGSGAARQALTALNAQLPGKEHLLLGRFGEALHPLQDSWSNAGVPDVPAVRGLLDCDPTLASAAPASRGGWASHDADRTARWPAEVLAMADASYRAMLAYPPVQGRARAPAAWSTLVAPVAAFAVATTKTEKRRWFVDQGLADTRFLGSTSLPDGPDPGPLAWPLDRFPPLPGDASTQFDAPPDARAFVDTLLRRWLGAEPVEAVVFDAMGLDAPARARPPAAARDLAARMTLWKFKDHGRALTLASTAPLTAGQRQAIAAAARAPGALLAPGPVGAAVLPVQADGPEASPLLPYVLRPLPDASRMIAIARLRHAPYDNVGWIVAQRGARWVLVDMVALPTH